MLIQGGNIVSGDKTLRADLRVLDEVITEIRENLTPLEDEEVIDAAGRLVLPGAIDVHTHFDMPAANCHTCDDFNSGSYAAIMGGTTSIIDFAECDDPKNLSEGLACWHKKAENNCYCDYSFHMTLAHWDDGMKEKVKAMILFGVTSFKAYTAYKGIMGVDDGKLLAMLEFLGSEGALLCVHCENGDVLEYLQGKLKDENAKLISNHPASRPNLVEKEAVSRVIDLAKMADAKIYIVHVSTKEALKAIKDGKDLGAEVYAETCPHYLLLDESKYHLEGFESAKYVMSPPLRTKEDNLALWSGLKSNDLDIVSTDHCSFLYDGQKDLGRDDFTAIPNGAPGVEHRPKLMLDYGAQHGMSINQIVNKLSTNPAKIFGLYPKKGVIAVGSDADIIIVNTNNPQVITVENSHQKTDYTPFEGFTCNVDIEDVILRGQHIVAKGNLLADVPLGRFIKRTITK